MLSILNRMCWNSREWLLPTNSLSDRGYSQTMGFGHEEWNFQLDDAVDDYVYGYLYYKPSKKTLLRADRHFRILFWSIEPQTGKKLLVGSYEDATVIDAEDYLRINQAFIDRGIYKRRAMELSEAVSSMTFEKALHEVKASVKDKVLSFKCAVKDVKHFENPQLLENLFPNQSLGLRFKSPTFLDPEYQSTLTDILIKPRSKPSTRRPSAPTEDGYFREIRAKYIRILRLHNTLSNKFSKWLSLKGFEQVTQEANFVDVTFSKLSVTYLAELKTCYGAGTTKAIREALGQLLEYNLYPSRIRADKWLIVLDQMPSDDDVAYINILRKELNFPLSLLWSDDSVDFKQVAGDQLD